jgi:hypothetical protein
MNQAGKGPHLAWHLLASFNIHFALCNVAASSLAHLLGQFQSRSCGVESVVRASLEDFGYRPALENNGQFLVFGIKRTHADTGKKSGPGKSPPPRHSTKSSTPGRAKALVPLKFQLDLARFSPAATVHCSRFPPFAYTPHSGKVSPPAADASFPLLVSSQMVVSLRPPPQPPNSTRGSAVVSKA